MVTWLRRRLRKVRHRLKRHRRQAHSRRHWSTLVRMYCSIPTATNPTAWVLQGVAAVGVVVLLIVGFLAYQAKQEPLKEAAARDLPGVPVQVDEVYQYGDRIYLRIHRPGFRGILAVGKDHPLAQEAQALEPGATIRLPGETFERKR